MPANNKRIVDLSASDAREQLLDPRAYCTIPLPEYINSKPILDVANAFVFFCWDGKSIKELKQTDASWKNLMNATDYVNYKLLTNKDGLLSWRPIELMEPICYVQLVRTITTPENWEIIVNRFKEVESCNVIECCSLPSVRSDDEHLSKTSILNWWSGFEQRSVELSLEYQFMITTDIADCYGSIYTHAISWALHGKQLAKKKRNADALLGNKIETILRAPRANQTNGIPQGSMLSDLIAEMVLGYVDIELQKRLDVIFSSNDGETNRSNKPKFKILRYRDDYRIFSDDHAVAQTVLLELMQVCAENNFKLNSGKTNQSEDIIISSIKPDKIAWLSIGCYPKNLHKQLLLIADFSRRFPNSGTLLKEISRFADRLEHLKGRPEQNQVLIAQVVDLMVRNPRCYPSGCRALSILLKYESEESQARLFELILKRSQSVPNRGLFEIWLQRIAVRLECFVSHKWEERICECLPQTSIGDTQRQNPFNFDWVDKESCALIQNVPIVDQSKLEVITPEISADEANEPFTYTGFLW